MRTISSDLMMTGGAGDDALLGAAAPDVLDGAGGGDTLSGRGGNDTLLGWFGDDHLFGGAGADRMKGGAGVDTAHYSSAGAGVSVNLSTGIGVFDIAAGDLLSGVENLVGSGFADTLTGDGADNALHGRGGRDILNGGFGDDTLTGGGGHDRFDFTAANINGLSGSFGSDRVLDFAAGEGPGDVLRLVIFGDPVSFAEVLAHSTQVGADTVIDFGGGNAITLVGVDMTTLAPDDFMFRFILV